MKRKQRRRWAAWRLLYGAVLLAGCGARRRYVAPEGPMPPRTILLSAMMRELSAQPGFTEGMLRQMEGQSGGKNGPALLTPRLFQRIRELILGRDWQGLDRFPGWSMREINPAVGVAEHFAGKDDSAKGPAIVLGAAGADGVEPRRASAKEISGYIDLGALSLKHEQVVDLNQPSHLPGFTTEGIVSSMGYGVVRGDGPDPAIAPMHAESDRLAQLLNRMSLNGMAVEGAAEAMPVSAKVGGLVATTPESLMDALVATGHTVTVADARYFANFGHFHYTPAGSAEAQDVMMPFWVDPQIRVPGTHRPLLVPVSHAEYEWYVRGPKVNADVAWYFGIDGKAEFRTMDELNQAWVLGRHAHEYGDGDAREVTRLVGRMVVAYMHEHIARPGLPFGGYYALGVCQDGVSAIEKKMTGTVTLFPNTADTSLFDDPRDAEVNRLMEAIPKDRTGAPPQPERVFGSLPTETYGAITIPGLAEDVRRSREAWQKGTLRRMPGARQSGAMAVEALGAAMAVLLVLWLERWRRRRRA